jgi:HlyD family secretion protein
MKKLILLLLVVVAAGVGLGVYAMRRNQPEPDVRTQGLSRGDIVDSVGATGTLEAVETVDVGTQVSGVVQALYADFNDIVKKGQIIARLDPQLIETQIEQQTANVVRAEAELDRLKVNLADAEQKLERARQMSEKSLIPRTELETAEVNVKSANAQIRSSEASLGQAQAQLNNQRVNLTYTTIMAPIDGIIISRNVDQGQTVASSMNAPVLYSIAADLTKMQVLANIDEADVGRMRPGQAVNFTVDAYPGEQFVGTVQQVRLQPAVVQNVVTYSTVIAVPNPQLKLKPGMTANVTIEIARRANVLRIPNAALRFRPTEEMFTVLNQEVPQEIRGGRGGRGGPGGRRGQADGDGASPAPAAGAPQAGQPASAQPQARTGSPESRGGGDSTGSPRADAAGAPRAAAEAGSPRGASDPNMTPEERRKRMEERMAAMTPEERDRFQARMREREAGGGGRTGGSGDRGNRQSVNQPLRTTVERAQMGAGATTIDSLFGPLPEVESRGMAWLYINNQLKPVRLRLGITDGTYTEVKNDTELQPGQEVVVNLTTGLEARTVPGQGGNQNPLMGPQRGGRGPGGGGRGR